MKVQWMPQAKEALQTTAKYIGQTLGKTARRDFTREVQRTSRLLEKNSELGFIEPLLKDRKVTYRSVIVTRLNKIVYRIMDDHIEIADFWDVRREPETLANQVK